MEKNVLLSVIIPTHNRCDLIMRAINSVLNQTIESIEVIVVSDGSTDETDTILKTSVKKDNRIKYLSYTPARGANYARNYGASIAQGEFIAFLDDDDAWHYDKAEKQLEIFRKDINVGAVTCGFHFIYVNQNTETNYIPRPEYDSSKSILMKNIIGGTPAVMLKKEIFDKAGCFDINMPALQDYDMWIRVSQISKIGVVSEPLIDVYDYFDVHKISNNTIRYIQAYSLIENKYQKEISSLTIKENNIRIKNFSNLIAKKGLRNNNISIAVKYAFKALKVNVNLESFIVIIMSFIPYNWVLKMKNRVKK